MTQLPSDTSVEAILNSLDVESVEDEQLRPILVILLNHVEQLESKVKAQETEIQRLRDELNRLKGEQGKPDVKPNRRVRPQKNHSSERERQTPQPHQKRSKNNQLKIDREQILIVPSEQLPPDAQFKGYEEVIVQDIKRAHR